MPTLMLETEIAVPIERCFDLARDVEIHLATAVHTQERIVGGKSRGFWNWEMNLLSRLCTLVFGRNLARG